jgi:RNase P protein component
VVKKAVKRALVKRAIRRAVIARALSEQAGGGGSSS